MPVIWILIVGGILYWVLRVFEAKHASKSETKSEINQGVPTASEAFTPVDAKPDKPAVDTGDDAPTFLDTIPGLPGETKAELVQLEYTTPKAISDIPDQKLLTVRGIGPARLKQIRTLCADALK